MLELLTIVTLPKEGRVKCQHEGCGRHVFARIHITRQDGNVSFVGSTCYRKLFGDLDLKPSFGGGSAIPLNEDEREQILLNTEAFLAELRSKYQEQNTRMPLDTPTAPFSEKGVPSEPTKHRALGKPTNIHLFRCLACSTPLLNYEFESTERICPQCKSIEDVFTLEKYPI